MSRVRYLPASRIAYFAAIAMLICVCASTALATPQAYAADSINVDGVTYTSAAEGEGESGSWSWDGESTLNLLGYKGDSITARGDLAISVSGDVELSFLVAYYREPTIEENGMVKHYSANLSLSGDGSIRLYTKQRGMYSGYGEVAIGCKDIDIDGVTVALENEAVLSCDSATIRNSAIVADGRETGIDATGKVLIEDSTYETMTVEDDGDHFDGVFWPIRANQLEVVRSELNFVHCGWRSVDADRALEIEDSVSIVDSTVNLSSWTGGILTGDLIIKNSNVRVEAQNLLGESYNGVVMATRSITLEKVSGSTVEYREGEFGNGDKWFSYSLSTNDPDGTIVSLIALRDLSEKGSIEIEDVAYVADGTAKEPAVTVRYGGEVLPADAYDVAYSGNVNPGMGVVTVTGKGDYTGQVAGTFAIADGQGGVPAGGPMFRLYNPWTGEHFYTAVESERDEVAAAGWTYEGIGWTAPQAGDPVYRLYNSYAGEHHYTPSADERRSLLDAGWTDEGVGWLTAGEDGVPLYREYNPYMFSCNHNYTADRAEHESLVALGWADEGVAWYGV